jgi:hypothetical protein
MNPRSMFVRSGCVLPGGFRLQQERFNLGWMVAGDISSTGLDATLRRSGWHFQSFFFRCSRLGLGKTEASAVSHATTRALGHIAEKFNVAEVDQVRVFSYPGFSIARVTAHARQIARMG